MKRATLLAVQAAQNSTSKFRVGACIVRNNSIALGWNQMNTFHPRALVLWKGVKIQLGLHAELHAMIRARFPLAGSRIYVARILANGKVAMAKPCEFCLEMLSSEGIADINYTDKKGKWRKL